MELYNIITKRGLDLNNFGMRVITKQLTEIHDDFEEYFKSKSFIKYKGHISFFKDLDTTLILSVILSKCIPFTLKYEDVENQPVTKLFYNTGSALLLQAGLHYFNRDKKNNKLIDRSDTQTGTDKEYKVMDYMKDNNILLNEEETIALGCDFINFFSERSNFFKMKEEVVKNDLRRRFILPKPDLKHLLDNVTFLDTEELPMIINPLP